MGQDLYISLGVGAAVGIGISVLFGLTGRKSLSDFSHTVLGTSVYNFVEQFFASLIALVFVVLATLAFIVKDGKFPIEHPWKFTAETLAMGFIPAALFLWSTHLRGANRTLGTWMAFLVLVLKCGIAHVLLQFSGVYTAVFSG